MNEIDLKQHVSRAIDAHWDRFAREHPNLARVLDRRLLIEQATRSIADDPEYQRAVVHALAVGAGIDVIKSLIERLVAKVLQRLI